MPALPQPSLRGGVLLIALAAVLACENGPTESRPREELLAASGYVRGDPDEGFALYVMRPDGSHARRLTSGIPVHAPEWSPDGRHIAFFGSADTRATRGIYIINQNGTQLRRITQGPDAFPTWSPDGEWLAFGGHRDGPGIYVMRSDGTEMHRILACDWSCSRPAWSPDGRQIAYVDWTPGQQVYLMASDGARSAPLSPTLAYSTDPAWSPDGSQIVVIGRETADAGEHHIFLVDIADGTTTRVTATPEGYDGPTFSGDGSRIAFSRWSNIDGRAMTQLYVMGRSGQGLTQITSAPNTFANPSWRP